jgi:hypothetical protein
MQHAASASRQGFLQDMNRTQEIDLPKQAARLRPQIGVGGQVIHLLAPLNRLGNRAPIPDIGPNYFNPGQGQMIDSRSGPFQDANRLTLVN